MTKSLSDRVLDLLQSEPFRVLKSKEIQRLLAIPQSQYQSLRTTLRQLLNDGKLIKVKKNRYAIARKANEIVGKLRVNTQGYGFVSWEGGGDVFVSQKNMGQALHKDQVRVRLFAASAGKNVEGEIIQVLESARSTVVGTFRWGRRHGVVVPDNLKLQRDVIILPGDDADAQEGQKVVCQIDRWENHEQNPGGKVIQVLGFPNEVGVDILSIIHEHELPMVFSDFVINQAQAIPAAIPEEELARRLDLRHLPLFTIDPEDAKDFDDAVSLEKLEEGWRLGVHIADVSYYVPERSAVDRSAHERGTSVYLVDRVIPMLPERLSNELCSLEEKKDRLTFSVIMDLSPVGQLLSYDLKETIICSKKRFSYQEAQLVLDGKLSSPFKVDLTNMQTLAEYLIAARKRRGSIDFDSIEVEIKLNDRGEPIKISPRERLQTNRLIEEFMLLANETVARHVGLVQKERLGYELPFIYRVHEKPSQKNIIELLQIASAFGFKMPVPGRIQPHFFQKLSQLFQKHAAVHVLQNALLHAMMKAQYSPINIGHFGLAYRYYTHFTSPIRRYPDLMVHRLLKQYSKIGPGHETPVLPDLDGLCRQTTACEIRAQEAERDSIKLKQMQFLQQHMNQEFDGIIVRILNFGFFVELSGYYIDGLVHVSSLDDDYYQIDANSYQLQGQYTGRSYTLGDSVRVRIVRIDLNEKLIDFNICSNDQSKTIPKMSSKKNRTK